MREGAPGGKSAVKYMKKHAPEEKIRGACVNSQKVKNENRKTYGVWGLCLVYIKSYQSRLNQ